ncbi:MAG: SDR family NAD(P)-dependent oxidoreductase [Proteobacteria bacterium]|nr:SDR family NAD(P)-dependent oxidoreductase [Pseudomonadota bacterium]
MIVLITGCRSGFGLHAAVEVARRGHTVYAGLRDLSTADALRTATEGLDVRPVQLDVTKPEERDSVVAEILAEHGRIDGLVNNAGIAIGGFVEEIEEDELRRVMEVNFFAIWALTSACLPAMRAQESGAIVNISSRSGVYALPVLGAYAASKWALEAMSESLRHEVRPFGIRVTLIEPGPYKTDIFDRPYAMGRNVGGPNSPYAQFMDKLNETVNQSKASAHDPRDVARKIADLLEAPAPALRHPMGPGVVPSLLARRFLPFGLLERLIAKKTGLTRG